MRQSARRRDADRPRRPRAEPWTPPTPVVNEAALRAGAIALYDPRRNFGFIRPVSGGDDVFFHTTTAQRCGIRPGELLVDRPVDFVAAPSGRPGGRHEATFIRLRGA